MPRTAAELRAAAVATGWFDGPKLQYVGDGYSIPWQTGVPISPVFGGLMVLWKAYLDTYYLEPSRLHDWLYTPYGPDLIQAERGESDLALREEMLAAGLSAPQVEVVYQACRLGGEPYFGRSAVGYVPPAGTPVGDNRVDAPTSGGTPVADFKVVMVFQQTSIAGGPQPSIGYSSVARTGGWTESLYVASSTPELIRAMMVGPRTDTPAGPILAKRAGCLNAQATIIGYRLYQTAGGQGQLITATYPGQIPGGDVPSMSLLCQSLNPATPSVRRFSMRGMPDGVVVGGEFAPDNVVGYTSALRAYFESLFGTSYRGRNVVTMHDIFTVSNVGLVTARDTISYPAGTILTVKTTLDAAGRKKSGEFLVATPGPLVSQLTLANWTAGATTGGKISLPAYAYFTLGNLNTTAVRIGNHKVGRGFVGYRGRNSPRRV